MGPAFKGYSEKELKEIKAQVLIMIGDREGVRPEHAADEKLTAFLELEAATRPIIFPM